MADWREVISIIYDDVAMFGNTKWNAEEINLLSNFKFKIYGRYTDKQLIVDGDTHLDIKGLNFRFKKSYTINGMNLSTKISTFLTDDVISDLRIALRDSELRKLTETNILKKMYIKCLDKLG